MYSIHAYFDISDSSGEMELVYSPDAVGNGFTVISAKFTEEINKAGEASFTIPSSHPRYNDFKRIRTMIVIMQDDQIVWFGRIFSIRRDFYFNKTITCEGALTFLNDICLAPFRYYEANPDHSPGAQEYIVKKVSKLEHLNYIIDFYNYRCHPSREIKVTTNISDLDVYDTISGTDSYNTVLNEIQDRIIEDYNYSVICRYSTDPSSGKIVITVNILTLPLAECGQKIEFGKNLIDFEEFLDTEDIYNSIVPLGSGNMSIYDDNGLQPEESVISLKDRAYYVTGGVESAYGTIDKVIEFSNIDNRDDLEGAAIKVLSLGGGSSTGEFTINAVDLHLLDVDVQALRVGYSVRVVSPPHKIDEDFVCAKASVDILNPGASEYSFCKPSEMSPETITEHFYDTEFRFQKSLNQKVTRNKDYGILNIGDTDISISLLL